MSKPELAGVVEFSNIPEFYLIVTQSNQTRECIVEAVNDGFADLLGARPDDIIGTNITQWLGKKANEAIEEMLEFESQGTDLYDVLSKQRQIKWQTADTESGTEIAFALDINRMDARSADLRFKLSVPDQRNIREKEQMKTFLRSYFEGRMVLDAETGLPDRATCLSFFDSLTHFVHAHDIQVAFATMRIDRFDKSIAHYGYEPCLRLIQHVAQGCRRALASEDVVVRINDQQLALFMFNVSRESARVILNRLRWLIRSHRIPFGGKSDFAVTVSFAFNMLGGDMPDEALPTQCEEALKALPEDERNQLLELTS
jgi:diguanylate cyclase (GGDEF)-like protein